MGKVIFKVEDLHVSYVDPQEEEKKVPILKGVSLEIEEGKIHAIMGPNGSGKSTLASVIMGHPHYEVEKGDILLQEENGEWVSLLEKEPHERARMGVFLSFQYPVAIPGLSVFQFLRHALKALGREFSAKEFREKLYSLMDLLQIDHSFATRYINDGFSGGEKKRMEVLQMALFEPRVTILDEVDSGLDIDAIKLVANAVNSLRDGKRSFIIITHYKRILNYIPVDKVHVLIDGRVAKEGSMELADYLEKEGYKELEKEVVHAGRS